MGWERFEDIQAWQKAKTLTGEIYKLTTNADPLRTEPRLVEHLQNASLGIMSHIARGFAPGEPRRFVDALGTALSCAAELQSLLYVCADLEKMDRRVFDRLTHLNRNCTQLIHELLALVKKSSEGEIPETETAEGMETGSALNTYGPLSPKDTPTRRSRAYPKTRDKNQKKDMGDYERPDMTGPYDNDDLLNPPEWKQHYTK
ncbi:four helix bundle protein [bacterium]|nr:four helix bundle protein [candidate division CSSED10-310 bacterium]